MIWTDKDLITIRFVCLVQDIMESFTGHVKHYTKILRVFKLFCTVSVNLKLHCVLTCQDLSVLALVLFTTKSCTVITDCSSYFGFSVPINIPVSQM